MTHVHAPVLRPSSEIAERARDIHPVQFTTRMLLTTIAAVFVAIGWSVGSLWFSAVFSVLFVGSRFKWLGQCSRHGFIKGARLKVVPKQ